MDLDKFCEICGIEKREIETIYQRQPVWTGCLYFDESYHIHPK